MEPITMTGAIVAAAGLLSPALADVGKDAIGECYGTLKATLKKKFGDQSDLVDAVAQLEKKPDSEGRKAMLQEEFEIAKVNDDPELIRLAQDLLDKIKEQPGGQQMIDQTQTNTVSGVNVGGNFNFAPVQDGGSK